MAGIQIKIGADGAGFHRTMQSVESRLHGLRDKVGFSFGETLAGLAGGATLIAMVDSMANWAKEIKNASDNLGVTTDRVQRLRQVARHAGKDLGIFSGIYTKSEGFASKALVPGSKEANTAARLGITSEDLNGVHGLDKDALVQKMLKGTEGMPRNVAEQLMGNVVGKKNAGFLIGNRDELTKEDGQPTASNEDIEKMVELKEQFEDLIDVVKVRLIPVFNDLVDWATKFIGKVSEGKVIEDERKKTLEGVSKQTGQRAGTLKSAGATALNVAGTLGALVAHGLGLHPKGSGTLTEDIAKINDKTNTMKYGKMAVDVANQVATMTYNNRIIPDREALAKASADRIKNRKDNQDALKGVGGTFREAPVTKSISTKLILGHELGGNNPFVKIGGLLGVDANYRMQRISEETNNILRQILAKIAPPQGDEQPEMDNDPS